MIDDIVIKDGTTLELRRNTPEEAQAIGDKLRALKQKAEKEGWPTTRFTISVEGTMVTISGMLTQAIGSFNDPAVLTTTVGKTLIRTIAKILENEKHAQRAAPKAGMFANHELNKSRPPKKVPTNQKLKAAAEAACAEMVAFSKQGPTVSSSGSH